MLNIKHSATQELIDSALKNRTNTKNSAQQRVNAYEKLMSELSSVGTAGRKFTRDDMNERR